MAGRQSVPKRVSVAGGLRARFSTFRSEIINGIQYQIAIYKHSRLNNHRSVVLFPNNAKPIQLQQSIKVPSYAKTPGGRKWQQLTEEEQDIMRDHDFKEVGKKLQSLGIKHRRKGGVVMIDNVKYTIHHHHREGHFELIRQDVHLKIGHIGMAQWHS